MIRQIARNDNTHTAARNQKLGIRLLVVSQHLFSMSFRPVDVSAIRNKCTRYVRSGNLGAEK
jgi:hypothetical protein